MWFGKVSKKASFLGFSLLLSLFGLLLRPLSNVYAADLNVPVSFTGTVFKPGSNSVCYYTNGNVTLPSGGGSCNTTYSSDGLGFYGFQLDGLNTKAGNYYTVDVNVISAVKPSRNAILNTDLVTNTNDWTVVDVSLTNPTYSEQGSNSFYTQQTLRVVMRAKKDGIGYFSFRDGSRYVLLWTGGSSQEVYINIQGVSEYEPASASSSTSQDITNQTQSLIDNQNQTRANDESQNQQAVVDAKDSTNLWTGRVFGAFDGLLVGLGSFFTYLTNWMSVDASVGCAFALPFLNETINIDMCNSLPNDIVSVIRNISAFIVFILIILILKGIFEDIFNLLEGSANAG